MITKLVELFDATKPYDQQTNCIEAFFDGYDPFWEGVVRPPPTIAPDTWKGLEGTDEETQFMINYVLSNCEVPQHIKEMLESWRDEGF